jgi:hypothetical protein
MRACTAVAVHGRIASWAGLDGEKTWAAVRNSPVPSRADYSLGRRRPFGPGHLNPNSRALGDLPSLRGGAVQPDAVRGGHRDLQPVQRIPTVPSPAIWLVFASSGPDVGRAVIPGKVPVEIGYRLARSYPAHVVDVVGAIYRLWPLERLRRSASKRRMSYPRRCASFDTPLALV